MKQSWLVVALGACLAGGFGCGGIGSTCPMSGSTEGCGSGKVCTLALAPDPDDEAPLPPVMVCLTACETSLDCADGEVCRVVCGSDELMSCQTGALPDFPADICGMEVVFDDSL